MTVLCGANAYEKKYYFNQDFASLPVRIQEELQIMCVMYTEEIGGIFTVEYEEDGTLELRTEAIEADAMYDEIGGALRIKQLQQDKEELFRSLELFYKVFCLGLDLEDTEDSENGAES
jgi:hypothetical protein